MYFGNKLVYENMLASGTVLWEGKEGGLTDFRIDLKGVTSKSNIRGIVVYFTLYDKEHTQSFTLKQLMNGVAYGLSSNTTDFQIRRETVTKGYLMMMCYNDRYITKITAL